MEIDGKHISNTPMKGWCSSHLPDAPTMDQHVLGTRPYTLVALLDDSGVAAAIFRKYKTRGDGPCLPLSCCIQEDPELCSYALEDGLPVNAGDEERELSAIKAHKKQVEQTLGQVATRDHILKFTLLDSSYDNNTPEEQQAAKLSAYKDQLRNLKHWEDERYVVLSCHVSKKAALVARARTDHPNCICFPYQMHGEQFKANGVSMFVFEEKKVSGNEAKTKYVN